MRNRKKTITIVMSVIAVLLIVSVLIVAKITSVSITIKTEYVSFTKEDGIITEVTISGQFNVNWVELTSENETIYDEDGEVAQIITTYDGAVTRGFLFPKDTVIEIEVSDSVDYIYVLDFDETIIIENGVIVDSLGD